MLTDPMSVTYNSTSLSLARTSSGSEGTTYATSDGLFSAKVVKSTTVSGMRRVEILFTHLTPDPTPDPFSGGPATQPNSFGFVYEFNSNEFYSLTDIPLIRTALAAFVTSPIEARLIAGEA